MNKKKVLDKWLYIPIIALAIYFIIRLVDQSQIIAMFPFDFSNDWASHIARLHFLKEYAYHGFVSNWYHGFDYILFDFYSPLWFFFALPLYFLFKNPQVGAFASLILIYIISFIFIFILGKNEKFSKTKILAFFLFLFVNPLTIGYFLRLGKVPEAFGWMWFIPFFALTIYYKDHKLDFKGWILFIVLFTLIFYSHLFVAVVAVFLIISLFLVKTKKGKFLISLGCLVILGLTSYFWYPLTQKISGTMMNVKKEFYLTWLLKPGVIMIDKIMAFVTPALLWIVFYFYYKSYRTRKELLFFLPPLILSFLHFTRISVFIPYINRVSPDIYHIFFLFLAIYLLLKIRVEIFSPLVKNLIKYLVIILPIVGIILSITFTPFFVENNDIDSDTMKILSYVEEPYMIFGSKESYVKAYYSYGAVYYNLTTPSGHAPLNLPIEYLTKMNRVCDAFDKKDCEAFREGMEELDFREVITYEEHCESLIKCGLNQKKKEGIVCLLGK